MMKVLPDAWRMLIILMFVVWLYKMSSASTYKWSMAKCHVYVISFPMCMVTWNVWIECHQMSNRDGVISCGMEHAWCQILNIYGTICYGMKAHQVWHVYGDVSFLELMPCLAYVFVGRWKHKVCVMGWMAEAWGVCMVLHNATGTSRWGVSRTLEAHAIA